MKPYRHGAWVVGTYSAVLIVIVVTASLPVVAGKRTSPPKPTVSHYVRAAIDPPTRKGMEHFYNMEYEAAIREFEAVTQQRPDDPFALNHLASAVMWKELYRVGALDTELYAKDAFLDSRELAPDPAVRQRLKELLDRSQTLAEKRLKANPNDTDALFARGAARAMRSTYIGMVDKAWFGALRSAIGARRDHERVLEIDPTYTDAKFVVGVHNYVMGSLSWAAKAAVAVMGLGGNKQKGLQYLREAAESGPETSVDAKIGLSLFLRREQHYKEAIELVGRLMQLYPHNYLAALEHANLLNAAGRGPEAIAAYQKLLQDGDNGRFTDARLELAAWGLGEALRGQRDFARAAEAYDSIPAFRNVDPELRDRSILASGEMYDVLNQREVAVGKYQAVVRSSANSAHTELAKKRLKRAYEIPKHKQPS